MASENRGIVDIVKKCKILLLDIEGTTTSISFVKDKLFPYAVENVKSFLDSQWEKEDVKEAVSALRKLALEDQESSVEGVVVIPGEDATKEDQIEGLVNNVKWQMSSDRKVGALKQLQGLIWKQGYDNGDIKGHVYDDVLPALEQWKSTEGHQIYIYSSGSVQAQKLLFGQSLAGDLLPLINGHFDTGVGMKQEAASYTNIVEKIACKPEEVLFLTDIVKEAEAARSAGLHCALVCREGGAAPPAGAACPVLRSLADLTPSNKRKQEPQDELPAKILKTDAETEVKSNEAEAEITNKNKNLPETTEKMEVEENGDSGKDKAEVLEDTNASTKAKEEVVIEELDSNEAANEVPMVTDIEPIITEDDSNTKTEEKETEETKKEKVTEESQNGQAENVVTTIEEIVEKQPETAEIIEDVVPVVEEPAVEEIEELKNVGEVLEKECDEILSKVQDVTNLDNIAVKPLLNSIPEEVMDTENTDSNDIVDRILDTELDLEMKQTENVQEKKEVQEDADNLEPKTENGTKDEASPVESNNVDIENKTTENGSDTNGVDQQISEETKIEEAKLEEKTQESSEVEKPEVEKLEVLKSEEKKVEVEATESHVNGKTMNGDAEPVEQNGDVNEEVSSRLVENGKEVNGTNGEAVEAEQGQGDKTGKEVADIKVKSVPAEEPRTDPVEHATEA